MTSLRWGILGAARIGHSLVPSIRAAGGEVVMVGSRRPENARDYAAELNIPQVGTYDDLLAADLDAIYNPLPNDLHLPWSEAAMRAGKHVLCEKPFTMNAAEARQLADVAAQTGRVLLEAFAYRFQPWVVRAAEIVGGGELGEVRAYTGNFGFSLDRPDDFRWKPELGGGALYDVGCYTVNLMRLLLGEPQSVGAQARMTDAGVDVGFAGVLRYPQALATISCSFDQHKQMSMLVNGTRGVLQIEDVFDSNTQKPVTLRWNGSVETFAASDGYAEMVRHFQAVAAGQAHPLYPPDDAVKQMRVLDALFASAREGRTVEVGA